MSTNQVNIERILGPAPPKNGLCLVATAKDELYFWPHFAAHYRSLGVVHFIVLDDNSTDGSLDWLAQQPDVTVLRSSLGFADKLGHLRFGVAARGLLAQHFRPNGWALVADLDEFWVPPSEFEDYPSLVRDLESNGHVICRGLMLDCFPDTLAEIEQLSSDTPPQDVAPYFDDISPIEWPADSAAAKVDSRANVRTRFVYELFARNLMTREEAMERGNPTLFKVPLAKWLGDVRMLSAHRLHTRYHDAHQMACAHYKFYPGWGEKVDAAIRSGAYYNQSVEYKMLALARDELSTWPLKSEKSQRFGDMQASTDLTY